MRILAFIFAGLLIFASCNQHSQPHPNVVIIFIDDMGYNDLGCYGGEIETPNIDRMARRGMRFTDFYVSQSVCSASRASLLTGCYSNRVSILGALSSFSRTGISDKETTLAEMLKDKGYATAIFGKWHLGHYPRFLPLQHGFDEYFGLPYSNDMWPHNPNNNSHPPLPLIEGDSVVQHLDEQSQLTTWYTEKAVDFIQRNADKPFFLYIPHTMVHVPLYVSEKFRDKSGLGLYADVVMELDWSVGKVMEALEVHGLIENTLVIFTSDNGPWLSFGDHGGSAYPLREGKGTAFEGGQRVPCIMQWPGTIEEGSTCAEPLMTIDVLPTIAALTGSPLPEKKIDGTSMLPLLEGEERFIPHEALFFYYGRKLNAVRSGRWKLHLPHGYRTLKDRPGGEGGIQANYDYLWIDTALYDMHNDKEETINLADQYPEVVDSLAALATKIIKELGDGPIVGDEVRMPGVIEGYIADKRYIDHLAKGKSIDLRYPYSDRYPAGGDHALVDGIRGTSNFHDGVWQAFRGDDLDATIDLGQVQEIDRVAVSFFEAVASWIFLPEEVEISISKDKKNFQIIGSAADLKADEISAIAEAHFRFPKTTARYVRVYAKSIGLCPKGHSGEGQKAWLFVDEIIIQ
jgi:arylsulfatase A-like enzyme